MKKSVIVLLHIGYWLIFTGLLSLIIIMLSLSEINRRQDFSFLLPFIFFSAIAVIPGMVSFYLHYTVLFKHYFLTRRIFSLVLATIVVALFSGIVGAFDLFVLGKIVRGGSEAIFNNGISNAIIIIVIVSIGALLNGIIGLVMRGFIVSYNDIALKEELNKKNYEIELDLIRAQINPHFLFNTINNIDVLIQKDPEKASAYLNKLSDMMRFMLYETKTEKIYLAKELAYIEKYIELQKIRTSNPDYIHYQVTGEPGTRLIEPMLFIPFIENAFKHAGNKRTENAIRIALHIEKNQLVFECENYYTSDPQLKPGQGGLGNELIRKRLLLLYPDKHTLALSDQNTIYKVKLTLNGCHSAA
jgi:two-component system LytT family sensor kinase